MISYFHYDRVKYIRTKFAPCKHYEAYRICQIFLHFQKNFTLSVTCITEIRQSAYLLRAEQLADKAGETMSVELNIELSIEFHTANLNEITFKIRKKKKVKFITFAYLKYQESLDSYDAF